MWPIRNSTDSTFKLLASESFILSFFFFFSFPIRNLFARAKDTRVRNADAMRRQYRIASYDPRRGAPKTGFSGGCAAVEEHFGANTRELALLVGCLPQALVPQHRSPDSPAACPAETGAADTHQLGLSRCRLRNKCYLGRRTSQASWKSHFLLPNVLWEQLLNGATSRGTDQFGAKPDEEEGKKVGETSRAPPRWLARYHKQVPCRTVEMWVPAASRPSLDPAAGYLAFSGVQSHASR